MPKFKVLPGAGKHTEYKRNKKGEVVGTQNFTEGQEFESEYDLDKMFQNKFERVGEDTYQAESYDPTFDKDDVMDEPLVVRQARKKKASEEDAPKPTARKESYGPVGSPPKKHKEAARRGKKSSGEEEEGIPKVKSPEEDEESEEGSQEEPEEETTQGQEEEQEQDVTDQFDRADEADVKVVKRGKEYFVYDTSAPDNPLNKDPFKSKTEVSSFVKSLAQE